MKYIIVDGEHCFRGVDIASILRYSRPVNAIRDQMPKKCKHTLDYVQAQATISGETPLTDLTDSNNEYIIMDSDDDTNSHHTST